MSKILSIPFYEGSKSMRDIVIHEGENNIDEATVKFLVDHPELDDAVGEASESLLASIQNQRTAGEAPEVEKEPKGKKSFGKKGKNWKSEDQDADLDDNN